MDAKELLIALLRDHKGVAALLLGIVWAGAGGLDFITSPGDRIARLENTVATLEKRVHDQPDPLQVQDRAAKIDVLRTVAGYQF